MIEYDILARVLLELIPRYGIVNYQYGTSTIA